MKCIKCNSYNVGIVCTTTFGHGDSSTKVECKCLECNFGTFGVDVIWDRGFPATRESMRQAQDNFNLISPER